MAVEYPVPPLSVLRQWKGWTGIPIFQLTNFAAEGLTLEEREWYDKERVQAWAVALQEILAEQREQQ